MYDSGGLALKPGDEVHAQMKNDMSGAAAVLAAMSALAALDCPTEVTGYLMCTDNMPSGTAMALGDVITIRGGTTVEVINTDAEGRLVMADALVLATEERRRRDRRHRHAHRAPACGRSARPSPASWATRPGPRRPGRGRGDGHRRAGLAAAAREALPQGAATPPSPTSATWAAPTPVPSPPGCSSRRSSATCRGRTSTSPARRRAPATPAGTPRAAPASAPGCWSSSPSTSPLRGAEAPWPTTRHHGHPRRRRRRRRGRDRGGGSRRRAHAEGARRHRVRRQQGAAPGDDVPLPHHRGGGALHGARHGRRQHHRGGRPARPQGGAARHPRGPRRLGGGLQHRDGRVRRDPGLLRLRADLRGAQPPQHRGPPVHVLVVRQQLRHLRRGGGHAHRHGRRRRGREGRDDGARSSASSWPSPRPACSATS